MDGLIMCTYFLSVISELGLSLSRLDSEIVWDRIVTDSGNMLNSVKDMGFKSGQYRGYMQRTLQAVM